MVNVCQHLARKSNFMAGRGGMMMKVRVIMCMLFTSFQGHRGRGLVVRIKVGEGWW